jgi:CubicO group peptidase (beta-lactamase class C family)
MVKKWGLSFLINTAKTPEGRSPNSLALGGLANTYFWIDPARNVSGVILMQLLPFADKICLDAFARIRARHLCRDRRRQRTESGLSSLTPLPRLRGRGSASSLSTIVMAGIAVSKKASLRAAYAPAILFRDKNERRGCPGQAGA